MKSLLYITLITALVASTAAPEARADREGRALVGGLIGGIIIGSILDDEHHHHHYHNRVHHRSRGHGGYDNGCGCSGHYDYISVKTWINGHWSVSYDRYGHCHRHWRPGYYSYDKRRVWVPHKRGCRYYSAPRHGHYDDHYMEDRHYRRH